MMYFQKSHFIIVAFYIQMVYSQDLTLTKENPPYFCGEDLTLKCQYSGAQDCCSHGTRIWIKNDTQIMTDGTVTSNSTAKKYKETVNVNRKYFELTIKNLETSDLGLDYECVYVFVSSNQVNSKKTHIECGKCYSCGPRCFGWACLGNLLCSINMAAGLFVIIWRDAFRNKEEGSEDKNYTTMMLLNGFLAALISICVSGVIAVPIGIYQCLCYDFKDHAYKHYPDLSFIALGYSVVGVTLLILACCNISKEIKGKDVCILILVFLTGPIGCIGLLIYAGYIYKNGKNTTGKYAFWIIFIILLLSLVATCGIAILLLVIWIVCSMDKKKQTQPSGKSQSVESGSSCWPICRVGQDPNSSSSDPEKVRRSPEKERADKKKERKPTEVVRPQPHRALPPMTQHLGTENTRRAEFSTETEMYKPRPLPSISGQSDSRRPLPKRTPDDLEKSSVQLKPLGDSISEKKKKKKRKKKETKLSDEDD